MSMPRGNNGENSIICGGDRFGDDHFAISVIKNGRPFMIEDAQQNRTFPSAVFRKNGEWQVDIQQKSRLKEPHLGAYAVKRLMGLAMTLRSDPDWLRL